MHSFTMDAPRDRAEQKKRLYKEAHDFYVTSKTQYHREMSKEYSRLVSRDVEKMSSCPRKEDRQLSNVVRNMRMKAITRTIKVNLDKKRTTEWTLPRLVAAVKVDRKHRYE